MAFSLRLLTLAAIAVVIDAELMARCGDCFCAPGTDGTCPTNETGINDSLPLDTECILETFRLTNDPDFLKLVSADGSEECYPFTDTVGSISGHPQTSFPPCVVPSVDSVDTSVCAYKYNSDETECAGRTYEVLTYDSEVAAVADGAHVTHTGGCGVCSSAQDFWVRIRDLDVLEENSVVCATTYALSIGSSNRFSDLVQCYENMGFTTPCATLWSHFGAVNSVECGGVCIGSGQNSLNLDNPPVCELAGCLKCSELFQGDFNALAGRTVPNSGLTERIVYPCSDFARVQHDHCVGTSEFGACVLNPTPVPESPESKSSNLHNIGMRIMILASAIASIFLSAF